jgi:hypothetical protein
MALKNYHFTFERHIFKNISFSLSYRTMPKTSIPFQDLIREQMGSNDIDFSKKFHPEIKSTICNQDACWCLFETNMNKRKLSTTPNKKVIPIHAN